MLLAISGNFPASSGTIFGNPPGASKSASGNFWQFSGEASGVLQDGPGTLWGTLLGASKSASGNFLQFSGHACMTLFGPSYISVFDVLTQQYVCFCCTPMPGEHMLPGASWHFLAKPGYHLLDHPNPIWGPRNHHLAISGNFLARHPGPS